MPNYELQGYGRESVYVAAQGIKFSLEIISHFDIFIVILGPTENSVEDFWRMIWEINIPTIVMLTKVYEGKVSWTLTYYYYYYYL